MKTYNYHIDKEMPKIMLRHEKEASFWEGWEIYNYKKRAWISSGFDGNIEDLNDNYRNASEEEVIENIKRYL